MPLKEGKVVKVSNNYYERARRIAEARGISLGEAIVQAGEEVAPSVSICEEEGFKAELRKQGITPPANLKWLFGFLDNFSPEMLKGSKLEVYAKVRQDTKGVCSLLPGAEEALEFPEGSSVPVTEPVTEEVVTEEEE